MKSDINVAIIEDDLYSLNWMSLLLVRDWRTKVIAEVSNQKQLNEFIKDDRIHLDIVLMDVDIFGNIFNFEETCAEFNDMQRDFKVLCIGCQADKKAFRYLDQEKFSGFILKQEIGYSLGWAISFAAEGAFLLTPSTLALAHGLGFSVPADKLVLSGRSQFPGITDRESEVARLAIIFSLGRRDLADELKISDQWSYGLVSELYTKLGLGDLFTGKMDLQTYFGDNAIIQSHIDEIMSQLGPSKKARDLETLAFHLLTMPDFED
jgi:DNA-binding NarL/FixJ family response regulator